MTNKCAKFVLRCPCIFMIISILPSIFFGVLLVQKDPIINVDTGFSQFRLENDDSTRNLDKYTACTESGDVDFSSSVVIVGSKYGLLNDELNNETSNMYLPTNLLPQHTISLLNHENKPTNLLPNTLWQQLNTISLLNHENNNRIILSKDGNSHQPDKGLILIYWNKKNQTLLTEKHITWMRTVEDIVQHVENFALYCATETKYSTVRCRPPNSMLNYMYPSVDNNVLLFDGRGDTLSDIKPVVSVLLSANRVGFFGSDMNFDEMFTTVVVSELSFGGKVSDQYFEKFIKPLKSKETDETHIAYVGGNIFNAEILDAIIHDAYFAFASLAFIIIYITIHVRSIFLAFCGVIGITFAFLPALYFQRIVYGEYMSMLNVLSLWLLAGIGADDIFVFHDTWIQSANFISDEKRFSWTFKQSSHAMLVTSFTTAGAFLGNMISLIPAIQQFGFFLGLLVIFNYIHIITWFPACVVLHHKYFETCICCNNNNNNNNNIDDDDNEEEEQQQQYKRQRSLRRASVSRVDLHSLTYTKMGKIMKKLHEFMDGRKLAGISAEDGKPRFHHDYGTRFIVILLSLLAVAYLSTEAIKLSPPTEAIALLDSDSNLETVRRLQRDVVRGCSSCTYPFGSDGVAGLPNQFPSPGVVDPSPAPAPTPSSGSTPSPTPIPIETNFPLPIPLTTQEAVSRPSAPQNVEITNQNTVSLTVSWSTPNYNGGSNILFYSIVTSIDGGNTWNSTIYSTVGAVTELIVSPLIQDTSYSLVVVASNENGYGIPSAIKNGITTQIVPLSVNIDSSLTNINSITINWSGAGTFIFYDLFMTSANPTTTPNINVLPNGNPPSGFTTKYSGTLTSFTLNGFCGNSNIYFYVRATTSEQSLISTLGYVTTNVSLATTLIGAPKQPSSITIIKTFAYNATIKVNEAIEPCETNGDSIKHYEIFVDNISYDNITTPSFITIVGLIANTIYSISVTAIGNNTGTSIKSNAINVATLTETPDSPTINSIISSTSTQAIITWSPPLYKGEALLIGYKLEVAIGSATNSYTTIFEPSININQVTVNVVEGTTYYYRLSTNNTFGYSSSYGTKTFNAPIYTSPSPILYAYPCVICSSITLNWSTITNATIANTIYILQVSEISNPTSEPPLSTTFSTIYNGILNEFIYSVTIGKYYIFRIASNGGFGVGTYSNEINIGNFTQIPIKPEPITFSDITYFTITLNWIKPSSFGGRQLTNVYVQYSLDNSNTFINVPSFDNSNINILSLKLLNISHNTPIQARIRYENIHGYSEFSNIAQSSTLDFPCPGEVPTIITDGNAPYGNFTLCNNRGTCNTTSNSCDCNIGYTYDCNVLCPGTIFSNTSEVLSVCSSQGKCSYDNSNLKSICICDNGFEGTKCELSIPPPSPPRRIAPSRAVKVFMVFGVKDVELTRLQKSSVERIGTPIFDTNFDLTSTNTHEFLADICERFMNDSLKLSYSTKLSLQVGDSRCMMRNFKQWYIKNSLSWPETNGTLFTIKLSQYLLTEGNEFQDDVGMDVNGIFKFVLGEFVVGKAYDNPASTLIREYYLWQDVLSQINNEAITKNIDGNAFHASETWPRIRTEQEFIDGVIFSSSFAIGCAALALIMFTMNLYLSILGAIILCFIILSLAGFFTLNNMTLGPVEAVSFSMVVGLGVDYSLHIAHQFVNQESNYRFIRASASAFRVGGSILSAALTTIGSTIILLATKVQLFKTFGIIACATAIISVVITLVTYLTILSAMGPNGNCCNIAYIFGCGDKKSEKQRRDSIDSMKNYAVSRSVSVNNNNNNINNNDDNNDDEKDDNIKLEMISPPIMSARNPLADQSSSQHNIITPGGENDDNDIIILGEQEPENEDWHCLICTYVNNENSKVCEICDAPR